MEKPKTKIDIPVLAAGSSSSEPRKLSKEITIQAIEAKLKMLENKNIDLEINKTINNEAPLIHKYQYNKNSDGSSGQSGKNSMANKYTSKSRYTQRPYNKRNPYKR